MSHQSSSSSYYRLLLAGLAILAFILANLIAIPAQAAVDTSASVGPVMCLKGPKVPISFYVSGDVPATFVVTNNGATSTHVVEPSIKASYYEPVTPNADYLIIVSVNGVEIARSSGHAESCTAPPIGVCSPLKLVGVRGSRENASDTSNMDHVITSVREGITRRIPTATFEAIQYEAIPVDLDPKRLISSYGPRYMDSIASGEKALRKSLRSFFRICPRTYVVLVGYSQGAQVAGNVFESLTRSEQRHVIMVLFGDPRFNPLQNRVNDGTYNTRLRGVFQIIDSHMRLIPTPSIPNVHNYCTEGDPFCNWSRRNAEVCAWRHIRRNPDCAHMRYEELGWTALASTWVVNRYRRAPKL